MRAGASDPAQASAGSEEGSEGGTRMEARARARTGVQAPTHCLDKHFNRQSAPIRSKSTAPPHALAYFRTTQRTPKPAVRQLCIALRQRRIPRAER
eukprot:5735961-Pleurochrysis_carterae.AAC.1